MHLIDLHEFHMHFVFIFFFIGGAQFLLYLSSFKSVIYDSVQRARFIDLV